MTLPLTQRIQDTAVLPDRSATTLATWLKQHPEIELATRDRSTEYARGLSEGTPQVKQVLDRCTYQESA